ncbi:FRG domain-containing protein [Granulicella tundricola]|uniref:FRG domain protein n=1 Tax=Granulicella tundricola (strain ATCC BAA-1859 / DSM 23138 / MP5ACTX9) TaxID=1198114 RepID=E8X0U6_GRATM|nr:FRG domain-containing protein [Granulicella tundricola]ADW70130.1 FRG domain protein [Granulicella tundricola MP5ACTX9]
MAKSDLSNPSMEAGENAAETLAPMRNLLGHVSTLAELETLVEGFRKEHPEEMLLFRGQTTCYPTVRSGLSRPKARYQPDVEQGLGAIIGGILGHDSVSIRNVPFRRAVLQHYSVQTHYIDLTSDMGVAAWFATSTLRPRRVIYAGAPLRTLDQSSYERRTEGLGYVLLFAIPNADELIANQRLFDISNLEPFLRPARQKAWLMSDRAPLLPDPNDFWAATITVDCGHFQSALSMQQLFPPPAEDKGYARLTDIPFVEIPDEWMRKEEEPRSEKKLKIDFGMRALPVPEYTARTDKDEFDHKWSDRTLSEAKPMQMWPAWNFELIDEISSISGNVANATKLTLSPRAQRILHDPGHNIPLRWPNLGTDELLFTFAQFGHDKVCDIEYPYHGVWLHRDKELVIEHPMTADEDVMNVHAGHVFEFIGQDLQRHDIGTSCKCGEPEGHEARVRAMLRLSALVEIEVLSMIPHPLNFSNWYFVL